MIEDLLASDWRDVTSLSVRGTRTTMAFSHLLGLNTKYDFVLFDMGPSLGAINRSILLACDYFITPMSTDIFSILALENIGTSIDSWRNKYNIATEQMLIQDSDAFDGVKDKCNIKFLGYVEQQYVTKSTSGVKRAVKAYDKILKRIPDEIKVHLIDKINNGFDSIDYALGSVPNYNSLIPMSQMAHKPIFSLQNSDGVIGSHYNKVNSYKSTISDIANHLLNNMEGLV